MATPPQTATALVKRSSASDVALMPPPPLKRIKRPSVVLDEDEYTSALSNIIARDYFPGLLESKAQHEYLAALESENEEWIVEAGQKLRDAMTPTPGKKRSTRNTRFDNATPSATPRASAADTPRGFTGAETPASTADSSTEPEAHAGNPSVDRGLSLGAFQAKYTSEDNASFNDVLDKQNQKRREKYAYLWTADQRLPSQRLIAHRAREARLLAARAEDEAACKALIPMTSGATASRSAKPDSWTIKQPNNTLMFTPDSVDEHALPTVQEQREEASKAGPKAVIHANTRFPTHSYLDDPGPAYNPASIPPPSPSLDTEIIRRRDAARAPDMETEYTGNETPRVNGYAFVDEDEPEHRPSVTAAAPSYRDLLAGHTPDATPNPFSIGATRRREDVHMRLVESTARKKREKERDTARPAAAAATPGAKAGNMTPAARRLMERIGGATPATARETSGKEMWTPVRTPRKAK